MRASADCSWALCSHFEQHLDHANIDALFEQMGSEAVPQGMRRYALGDSRQVFGGGDGAVELPRSPD